jgi:hypothetical protein
VIAVPNRLRTWFDAIIRSGEHGSAAQPERFGFDQLLEEQGGFHLLAEEAGQELVLGFIGRWWDRGYLIAQIRRLARASPQCGSTKPMAWRSCRTRHAHQPPDLGISPELAGALGGLGTGILRVPGLG